MVNTRGTGSPAGGDPRANPGLGWEKPGTRRGETRDSAGCEFDLDAVRIEQADQRGARGDGALSRATLNSINLSGARLGPLSMADVVLDDVELSNATLPDTTVRRVELLKSRGIGLRLTLTHAVDFYAEDCRLDHATIRIQKVKNAAVFAGCSFRETVLLGDLSKVVFVDCELNGTEFEAQGATDCDLRASNLTDVRGLLTLRGAKITTEQAIAVARQLAAECGLSVVD